MESMKKLLKKFSSRNDIIVALLGITLLILLVFIYLNPKNKLVILFACISCGLLNVMQGLKYRGDSKKMTTAASYIIIIVVGIIVFKLK